MDAESEGIVDFIKAYLELLGFRASGEELSKLSRDLDNVLKISKVFNEVVSHEEGPAILFSPKVEDDEKG